MAAHRAVGHRRPRRRTSSGRPAGVERWLAICGWVRFGAPRLCIFAGGTRGLSRPGVVRQQWRARGARAALATRARGRGGGQWPGEGAGAGPLWPSDQIMRQLNFLKSRGVALLMTCQWLVRRHPAQAGGWFPDGGSRLWRGLRAGLHGLRVGGLHCGHRSRDDMRCEIHI